MRTNRIVTGFMILGLMLTLSAQPSQANIFGAIAKGIGAIAKNAPKLAQTAGKIATTVQNAAQKVTNPTAKKALTALGGLARRAESAATKANDSVSRDKAAAPAPAVPAPEAGSAAAPVAVANVTPETQQAVQEAEELRTELQQQTVAAREAVTEEGNSEVAAELGEEEHELDEEHLDFEEVPAEAPQQ